MQILIERGKHGDQYHDASTPEAVAASSLAILTERWEAGYYYYDPGPEPEWKGPGRADRDKLKELDKESWDSVQKRLKRFKNELRYWQQDNDLYQRIKKAVETKDGGLAWECLYDRSDHEYEGVELEEVQTHEV